MIVLVIVQPAEIETEMYAQQETAKNKLHTALRRANGATAIHSVAAAKERLKLNLSVIEGYVDFQATHSTSASGGKSRRVMDLGAVPRECFGLALFGRDPTVGPNTR